MGVDELVQEHIMLLREDKARLVALWLKDGVDECAALEVAIRLGMVVVRNGYTHVNPYPYLVVWADEDHRLMLFQLREQPEVLEVYSDTGGIIRGTKASEPYKQTNL